MLPTPVEGSLPFVHTTDALMLAATDYVPTLQEFGFSEQEIAEHAQPDKRQTFIFKGGEKYALERLEEFIFARKAVGDYHVNHTWYIGETSRLSPWLANGSLSVRRVYHAVKEFDKQHAPPDTPEAKDAISRAVQVFRSNVTLGARQDLEKSTKDFVEQLFYRDFFKFWSMKNKDRVYREYGVYER